MSFLLGENLSNFPPAMIRTFCAPILSLLTPEQVETRLVWPKQNEPTHNRVGSLRSMLVYLCTCVRYLCTFERVYLPRYFSNAPASIHSLISASSSSSRTAYG